MAFLDRTRTCGKTYVWRLSRSGFPAATAGPEGFPLGALRLAHHARAAMAMTDPPPTSVAGTLRSHAASATSRTARVQRMATSVRGRTVPNAWRRRRAV